MSTDADARANDATPGGSAAGFGTLGSAVGTIYGVLLNDPATVARLHASFGAPPYQAPPRAPVLYIKSRNTIAPDGAAVAVPPSSPAVRIDATVGAVIGSRASRVAAADALDHVVGYVVVSDVTLPHDTYYRPAVRQRCRDGFCPMTTRSNPPGFDVASAEVVTSVNDVVVHRRHLSRVVRPLPRLIEEITAFMTLEAGDVLLLGPPDGAPTAAPGDRVTIEVAGLGTLSHTVVAEDSSA